MKVMGSNPGYLLKSFLLYLPSSNCTWKSDRFCHRWITLGVSVTNQVDSTIFSTIIWPFNQHLQKEFCDFTETDVLASKVCRHMVKPLMPQWAEIILEVAFSWILMEQLWSYFFLSPPLVAGSQKPQKLATSKIKYKHFGPKILILHWKMNILVS